LTCNLHVGIVGYMATTLQVRNVTEELSSILKQRAAASGLSLSDYVLHELEAIASKPTIADLNARISERGRVELPKPAVAYLREERAERNARRPGH